MVTAQYDAMKQESGCPAGASGKRSRRTRKWSGADDDKTVSVGRTARRFLFRIPVSEGTGMPIVSEIQDDNYSDPDSERLLLT